MKARFPRHAYTAALLGTLFAGSISQAACAQVSTSTPQAAVQGEAPTDDAALFAAVVRFLGATRKLPLRIDPRPLRADTAVVFTVNAYAPVEQSVVAARADELRSLAVSVGDIIVDGQCANAQGGVPYIPEGGQPAERKPEAPADPCKQAPYSEPFIAAILSLPRPSSARPERQAMIVRVNLISGWEHRVVDVLARRKASAPRGWEVVEEREVFLIQK